MKPEFLLIGSQKCGTKTLMHYLYQHPRVWRPAWREMNYFSRVEDADASEYAALFAECPAASITGESTPDYLFTPCAAERIKRTLPSVRLIVLLRNPAERAISHYYHNCRKGRESLSLLSALDAEQSRCSSRPNGEPWPADTAHFAYFERGLYLEQLRRYWSLFDDEQMLVLHSKELWQQPQATFDRVCDFLGLERHQPEDRVAKGYGGYQAKKDPDRAPALARLRRNYVEANEQLFEELGVDWGWNL